MMRASDRSAMYGRMLEPPPPPPTIMSLARVAKAETVVEHDARMARKTTRPAPKSRRRQRGVQRETSARKDCTEE
jgi:hypothetical protein